MTRNDADFFRLNRGFTRITQNDADFGGVVAGLHLWEGEGRFG